jgi:hypothetical protein
MSTYKLLTYPNCENCTKVKEYLGKTTISFQEIPAYTRDGKIEVGKIQSAGMALRRDAHGIIMPILMRMNDSKIEAIAQGPDDVETLFT